LHRDQDIVGGRAGRTAHGELEAQRRLVRRRGERGHLLVRAGQRDRRARGLRPGVGLAVDRPTAVQRDLLALLHRLVGAGVTEIVSGGAATSVNVWVPTLTVPVGAGSATSPPLFGMAGDRVSEPLASAPNPVAVSDGGTAWSLDAAVTVSVC
jgi:hypothetical protein